MGRRKALVVGINHYTNFRDLYGCVNDAQEIARVLGRHATNKRNFDVELLLAQNAESAISRSALREKIMDLFHHEGEAALLYFAGHGFIDASGGFIVTSEGSTGDDGLALVDILTFAAKCPAHNKLIILDSCHSGIAGASSIAPKESTISEGMTVLTASTAKQYADEKNGCGVFTSLLVDALEGAAANLVGDITPGAIYAHIDQSLGSWEQRPVFKTNIREFISLRQVAPRITIEALQQLPSFFQKPDDKFRLDPSFEPEIKGRDPGMPLPDPENTARFAVLQQYNRHGLLVPVGVKHMWSAAMESRTCELTALGRHYLRLVERELL